MANWVLSLSIRLAYTHTHKHTLMVFSFLKKNVALSESNTVEMLTTPFSNVTFFMITIEHKKGKNVTTQTRVRTKRIFVKKNTKKNTKV